VPHTLAAAAAILLAFWLAWLGYLVVQRSRVARFVGVPVAYVQPQHNGILGMDTPAPYFYVTSPDGRHLASVFITLSGRPTGITLAVRSGGLIEQTQPDPLLSPARTDQLGRTLVGRYWRLSPAQLRGYRYKRSQHGSVTASWTTSDPRNGAFVLRAVPGHYVSVDHEGVVR
jgi:hypothetical protein